MTVVAKAGGTTMASPESIGQFVGHLERDLPHADDLAIVVSAPGKLPDGSRKVTDLLSDFGLAREFGRDTTEIKGQILERFAVLGSTALLAELEQDLKNTYLPRPYLMSRGEHYSARMFAENNGFAYQEIADIITFDRFGNLDEVATRAAVQHERRIRGSVAGPVVYAGYYGANREGEIKVFPRGGSDITAAVVARYDPNAVLHLNYTDVDGVHTANPSIVPVARQVRTLDYREQRALGVGGATVIHPSAVLHLSRSGVDTHIYNTFNESTEPGTVITSDSRQTKNGDIALGVAGRGDLWGLSSHYPGLDYDEGTVASALSALKERGYHLEGTSGGTDSFTVFVTPPEGSVGAGRVAFDVAVEEARGAIKEANPKIARVDFDKYGSVRVVGNEIIKNRTEVAMRATHALYQANVSFASPNSDPMSPEDTYIVPADEVEQAERALHAAFFEDVVA